MSLLPCLSARLRAHYLISQSPCQNMLGCAKYLYISNNYRICPKWGVVESVESVWKYSTKKCGWYPFYWMPYFFILLYKVLRSMARRRAALLLLPPAVFRAFSIR